MLAAALACVVPCVPAQSPFGDYEQVTSSLRVTSDAIAADCDGDGDQDVIVASRVSGEVAYFEAAGDGTFAQMRALGLGLDEPEGLAAADLDGDGALDLVVVDRVVGVVRFLGDGQGGFSTPQFTGSTGRRIGSRLTLVDIDGDGNRDVLTTTGGVFGESPSVFVNLNGVLSPAVPITGGWAQALTVLDADGDGDLDLVLAEPRD